MRGPVNRPRAGIVPLEGIVETDWSVAAFTLNWQFTLARELLRFEPGDVIARLVPMRRHELETFDPVVMSLQLVRGLKARVSAWNEKRHSGEDKDKTISEYRIGRFDLHGTQAVDHQTKLRLGRFRRVK